MPGSCGARARDPAATRPLLSREEGCLRPDPRGRATVWDSAAEHALRWLQYLAGALAPASGMQSARAPRAPALARRVTPPPPDTRSPPMQGRGSTVEV